MANEREKRAVRAKKRANVVKCLKEREIGNFTWTAHVIIEKTGGNVTGKRINIRNYSDSRQCFPSRVQTST